MSTDVMIEARELSKSFGSVQALDKVSFEVRRGEVVGFLGPNGAGKSTTMRILTSFIAPSSGNATVHGFDVFEESLQVRRTIGYLPQRAPLYQDMTVDDYLRFAADIRGIDAATFANRRAKVVEVCGLGGRLNQTIGTLSHGFRQRVGLGQALLHDPPILILDEPTADLDPNEKAELLNYIQDIGEDHTILLSTHILSEVEAACGRAIIVSEGKIVADGSLDNIRQRGGGPRYVVVLEASGSSPLPRAEVAAAFGELSGADVVKVMDQGQGQGQTLTVEFGATGDEDLRREVFRLAVDKGWVLLESRREALGLENVFRDLTRDDEIRARGPGRAARGQGPAKKSRPQG